MNNEHAELLITAIQTESQGRFDMSDWFQFKDGYEDDNDWFNSATANVELALSYKGHCQTACCIAGTAAFLSKAQYGTASTVAEDWLDLTPDESEWLFMGWFSQHSRSGKINLITKEEAIEAIRWLMAGNTIMKVGEKFHMLEVVDEQ